MNPRAAAPPVLGLEDLGASTALAERKKIEVSKIFLDKGDLDPVLADVLD